MIGLAYKSFRSKPSAKSVFWSAAKLPIVLEMRKMQLLQQNAPTKAEVAFEKDRAKSPIPGALVLDPNTAVLDR